MPESRKSADSSRLPSHDESQDTGEYRQLSALGVYDDSKVLKRLDEIFNDVNVGFSALEVAVSGKPVTVHKQFEKPFDLYLLPIDYTLPGGGINALVEKMAEGSKVIYMTDKPSPTMLNPRRPLTAQEDSGVTFYGFVTTNKLGDDHYVEFFKQAVRRLLFSSPDRVLVLAPLGYEHAKGRIDRLFEGKDTRVHPADSQEKALKMMRETPYDEIYLPEGMRSWRGEVQENSRTKPPCILFFTRDNGIYLFEE